MKITGPIAIDASKWDHHLNIQELLDGGVVSVILGLYRQKSGKTALHDNCKRILDQVSPSPLILQTYKYYYPQEDPIRDADWFADIMQGYPISFAWADCEEHDYKMEKKLRSEQNRRFTAQVYSRFQNVGVYTRKSYVDGYAPEMNLWLGKYPTWISHYGHQPSKKIMATWAELKKDWLPNYNILVPTGAKNVVGHQFTGDRFMLPGVYDAVGSPAWWFNKGRLPLDVNVFTPQFIDSIGNASQEAPTTPHPQNPAVVSSYAEYVVIPGAINVRSGPSVDAPFVRLAKQGEILQVTDRRMNGYARLTDGTWVYAASNFIKLK